MSIVNKNDTLSRIKNIFQRPFGRWIKKPYSAPQHRQRIHSKKAKQDQKLLICYETDSDRMEPNKRYWRIHRRDALIQGYVRCYQSNIELPFDVIHMLMIHLFEHDIWIKYGKHIDDHLSCSVSSFGECIERISDNDKHFYYCFGNNIVSRKSNPVQRWIVQLNKIEICYQYNDYNAYDCSMIIGIAESNKINHIKHLLGDFTYGTYNGYGLKIGMKSEFAHKNTTQSIYIEKGRLTKGDIVTIELDLRSTISSLSYHFEDKYGETIQYGVDEKYQWPQRKKYVAFDTIDTNKTYRLVVGMYRKNKLTFLSKMHT